MLAHFLTRQVLMALLIFVNTCFSLAQKNIQMRTTTPNSWPHTMAKRMQRPVKTQPTISSRSKTISLRRPSISFHSFSKTLCSRSLPPSVRWMQLILNFKRMFPMMPVVFSRLKSLIFLSKGAFWIAFQQVILRPWTCPTSENSCLNSTILTTRLTWWHYV